MCMFCITGAENPKVKTEKDATRIKGFKEKKIQDIYRTLKQGFQTLSSVQHTILSPYRLLGLGM